MTTTINISLNVPSSYRVEELQSQLTEYGKQLIAQRTNSRKSRRRASHHFLKGLTMPQTESSEQLIDEYLKEKYDV